MNVAIVTFILSIVHSQSLNSKFLRDGQLGFHGRKIGNNLHYKVKQ